MKYLILLSVIFFTSEFLLMLVKRSNKSDSKHRKDRGSLILLWITISLCFTFGFMFTNHRVWDFLNYILFSIGLFLIIIGLIIRWASILQLKKAFTVDVAIGTEQKLKTDGLYKVIRHPSYLGLLLIMVGFSIAMNSLISILLVTIPMFLAIHYRIIVEEKALTVGFGEAYKSYKTKTKRLIPWIY